MKTMMWVILVLGTIVLLDAVLDIIGDWFRAIKLYRKGWRVR